MGKTKYIDADRLLAGIYSDNPKDVMLYIATFPAADVVEVIRCKDCKYDSLCFSDVEMTNRSQTENIYKQIEWCSYGERKDG